MAKLIYSAVCSLDGYVVDAEGNFDWAAPDDEVHAFVNERERSIGTYLYGRRMYETMRVWEHPERFDESSAVMTAYAELWQDADKIVYSTTLHAVGTERTWLEAEFDPTAVARLKDEADHDVSVGGPHLAAAAIAARLVDEVHLYLCPVSVGGGTPALPLGVRLDLELVEEHRFASGVVFAAYSLTR